MRALLLLLTLAAANAQNWNALKVKWGLGLDSYDYRDIPLTVTPSDGFFTWSEETGCDASNQFYGRRFVARDDYTGINRDYSVMPIYDNNGIIAGISIAVPVGAVLNVVRPPMVLDTRLNMYTMTAYFTDPRTICSRSKTEAELQSQGIGDRLIVQWGSTLRDISLSQDSLDPRWKQGQCIPLMGMHYWYEVTASISCDQFTPMFLLYNNMKQLDAFGWIFMGFLDSPNFEYPPPSFTPGFLPPNDYPQCVTEQETLSSMHIYLVNEYDENRC